MLDQVKAGDKISFVADKVDGQFTVISWKFGGSVCHDAGWAHRQCAVAPLPTPLNMSGTALAMRGIHRRSAGRRRRRPGSGRPGVSRIRLRRRRTLLRKPCRSCRSFRCRVTCRRWPGGRFPRNRCRAQCSGPSLWDKFHEGRIPRNNHRHPHKPGRLRCRIGILDAPWFSPSRMKL